MSRIFSAWRLTRVFLNAVFRFYKERALERGLTGGQTGSITVVQRFGSALNLNIHLHCLVLDGVFVKGHQDGSATFHPLPAPTTEQIEALLVYAVSRMERWLKRQGFDQPQEEISDEDAFAALASASIAGRVALGIRAGKRVRRVRRLGGREVRGWLSAHTIERVWSACAAMSLALPSRLNGCTSSPTDKS